MCGGCPDNAASQGFFGRLKTELCYARNWQSATVEQFVLAQDSYIRWYNEKRINISLGSLSPVEYRRSLGFIAQPVQDCCRPPRPGQFSVGGNTLASCFLREINCLGKVCAIHFEVCRRQAEVVD